MKDPMNGATNGSASANVAPADARQHAAWRAWKKILAYLMLAAVSVTAIWFVDVKVHRSAMMPVSPKPLRPGSAIAQPAELH